MKNVEDLNLGAVRQLRRAFGKLRHRKFWKGKVKGGVAAIEVTNTGNGWHPHLHAVIDCRWLADKEIEPRPFWSREEKAKAFEAGARSVEKVWAKLLKQPTASIFIKRANKHTILKEVVKYSIKGSDLASCGGEIAQLIDAMEGTRLLTTFGSVFGIGEEPIGLNNKKYLNNPSTSQQTEKARVTCCASPELIPSSIFDTMMHKSK